MSRYLAPLLLLTLIGLNACRGETDIGVPQEVYGTNRVDSQPQKGRPGSFCNLEDAKRGGC